MYCKPCIIVKQRPYILYPREVPRVGHFGIFEALQLSGVLSRKMGVLGDFFETKGFLPREYEDIVQLNSPH